MKLMLLFLQALRRGYATTLGAEVVKVCVWKGEGVELTDYVRKAEKRLKNIYALGR